jgi:eukaryotic-like serine/threonine-protein kinase
MSRSVSGIRATIGGYEVLRALSSGGMGDVLLARRRGAHGFEKLVALKTIRSDLRGRDDLRTMFLDEARLVGRLEHPAIAQVYDFGEEQGTLFLAMEYVAGVSFADLRDRLTVAMPPGVAARAMAEVCRGLHAAHEAKDLDGRPLGVVHRDVSPQNLILTFDGRVKILDFGIALGRNRQTPVTVFGTIKGKPSYMGPEQLKGGAIDRRADIFAACVILHEILTGKRLFAGDTIFEIANAVQTAAIPAPSSIAGPLPPGLDAVVLHGLQRDVSQRFQDAAAMAGELETIASACGAETLESFSGRELALARETHQRFLRETLGNSELLMEVAPTPGRQPGMRTVQGNDDGLSPTEQLAPRPPTAMPEMSGVPLVAHELIPTQMVPPGAKAPEIKRQLPQGPAVPSGQAKTLLLSSPARRWRWPAIVVALAAALVLGVAASLLLRKPPGRTTVTPVTLTPSARPLPDSATPATPVTTAEQPETRAPDTTAPEEKSADEGRATDKSRSGRNKRPALSKKKGAPTESPKAPTSEEFGYLRVTAEPYANVRIDGAVVGATPLLRFRLTTGSHVVELVSPDSGEVRQRQTVTIEKDKLGTITGR